MNRIEGSDKELKNAQNILDEPELPETEPSAITLVFKILLGEPPNGSVSEIRENVEDEEITEIDLRRMMFFLGRIFEEIAPNPRGPKSFQSLLRPTLLRAAEKGNLSTVKLLLRVGVRNCNALALPNTVI